MKRKLGFLLVFVIVAFFLVFNGLLIIVDETKQVVITQLGKPVRAISTAGLHLRIPFIQSVTVFDKRLLVYDSDPEEVITKDKKTLLVDNYARWRIVDPLEFMQSVKTEQEAQSRLDDIVYSELRAELGKYDLNEIVARHREAIMTSVTENSNKKAQSLGIEIVDVRIKGADLPQENERAVFERMRTERERQARLYRSEGEQEAARIRAEADREKEEILADAYRQAQEIMGKADAEAIKIYNQAFQQDKEFYQFWRSLESYQKALVQDTTIILSPDSDFGKYLKSKD